LPQVWLTDDELGDFLGCDPVTARHTAIERGWPRGFDEVMRFRLPPAAALRYVLLNAQRHGIPPRDAILFEKALDEAVQLRRQLAEARATISALQDDLHSLQDRATTGMVSALNGIAARMRREPAHQEAMRQDPAEAAVPERRSAVA
jgi:hypothetical protein